MLDLIFALAVVALREPRDYHIGARRGIPNSDGRSISHLLADAEFVIRHCDRS
jgi:hypothetical protein